jgi:DNA-binding CsgD family transcriptional regulator
MSWPLTGRSEEMAAVQAAIASADVSGIVVCGAAGIGKSRIAREALTTALARGCEGRWVVGTSSARGLPLGAFSAWSPSDAAGTVQLVRGVIESLTVAPAGRTVVVVVDDVHLLDELSIFVVQQIVLRGAAKVVLTVRDDEPIPPEVQEIWRGDHCERLDLQPLSLDETATLLSATLDGAVEPTAAQRLWTLTGGNALYLRNIVEQEVADGRLEEHDGLWRWIGDPIVAPGLVELVESRIGTLPTLVGDVVDVLAVGEPLDLAALTRITDAEAVEEADVRGLVRLEPAVGGAGLEVRIAHPLYGEVRRKRAAPTRLRRLRGLVATELAASDNRDDVRVVVRRATLSLDSDLPLDADLLVRAANGAVWLADLPLAARLAEGAIRAGAGPEANFVRAHALSWLSAGEDADLALAGIDTNRLTDVDRAKLAFLRASNVLWVLADPARAKQLIDDAAHTAVPEARSYVDAFRTVYWFALDQPVEAAQVSEGLDLEELPAVVDAEMAWVLAAIAADAGHTDQAVAVADAGYAVATRSFDAPQMRFNIADAHVSALLFAGRIREAGEVAARVRAQAADLPGAAHLLGSAVAGRAALGAGDLDTACALLEVAAPALSASGHGIGWGYRYRFPRVSAMALRGSVAEAAEGFVALEKIRRPFRSLDYERSHARAWVAAGQGAVSEAVAVILAAAERASANGQFAAEVMCLQTACQFGDKTGADRLRELTSIVEGPRVGVAARFAAALAAGSASELDSVSRDFEAMGDLIAAMDAAAHATVAYRRRGQRGSALLCSTRAQALARQCGGARTPALLEAVEELPLSAREREVVMLVAEGLSSRAIADRLILSIRTVDSHIYRAMAKTGTKSREELGRLLRPRDEPPEQS